MCVLARVRSATAMIVVGSLAELLLGIDIAACADHSRVGHRCRSIGLNAHRQRDRRVALPGARGSLRLQITAWAAMLQVQPAPAADVGTSPVGTLSVTVIAPLVDPTPELVTVTV